jgi:hypothetical protein
MIYQQKFIKNYLVNRLANSLTFLKAVFLLFQQALYTSLLCHVHSRFAVVFNPKILAATLPSCKRNEIRIQNTLDAFN